MATAPDRTSAHAVQAQIGDAHFPIFMGCGQSARVGALWAERAAGTGVLLIADGAVEEFAEGVRGALTEAGLRVTTIVVPPGESSKSFAEMERITRAAAAAGLRRTDAVVAVGGGVVGDLAGFVAASYQRGVRLVHVPTTLLAMVDSAIGGKTAIDIPEGKNYVGAIWQPQLVVMDLDALETLPPVELACGFAEVVKYGLLESVELFEVVERYPALPGERRPLTDLIRTCVEHKLRVVAADERETGLRASLNLGHTVGHGIEAAGGYRRYRHGEAISLGMLAALRLSEQTAGLDPQWRERTRAILARHGLPVTLDPAVSTDDVLAAMGRDKKADDASLNMVLLSEPGTVLLRRNPSTDLVVAAIEELRAPSSGDAGQG